MNIELRGIFNQQAPDMLKTWVVHAVKVEIKTDQITLDEEASEYEWIDIKHGLRDDNNMLPGFVDVMDLVLN